jgi:hypothetical protein
MNDLFSGQSMIEIAIFPSGKLQRPKEKLEIVARQEVLGADDGGRALTVCR